MPLTGGYDVKVIDGSGLYGLPMYRVGTGASAPPPDPLPLVTDAATGLNAANFNLSPSFTQVNASTGRYYTNGGNASFQNRRPIQPFTKLDVTQPGFVAHGALITSAVSNDLADVDAAFSRVIEDRAAFSPELVGDATSPTRLQSIATFSAPTGQAAAARHLHRPVPGRRGARPAGHRHAASVHGARRSRALRARFGDGLPRADLRARAGIRRNPDDGRLRGRRRRQPRASAR